jgi:hypothetical protein
MAASSRKMITIKKKLLAETVCQYVDGDLLCQHLVEKAVKQFVQKFFVEIVAENKQQLTFQEFSKHIFMEKSVEHFYDNIDRCSLWCES